jgi:hypothetical protein
MVDLVIQIIYLCKCVYNGSVIGLKSPDCRLLLIYCNKVIIIMALDLHFFVSHYTKIRMYDVSIFLMHFKLMIK